MIFSLKELRREYQNCICICTPRLRDARNHRAVAWQVEELTDTVDEARRALERLDLNGANDAVPISTSEQIVIERDLAARFFRVFFGVG